MGEKTGISWTDSTFNPWIGCTKVGPGCDQCYAEATNHRFHDGKNWGAGAPRQRTNERYWRQPLKWNEAARESGNRHLVFCASQADVFDNEAHWSWRADLWRLIRETPHLTWQIVTKRIGNARSMLPSDWRDGYPNVWLIATIVNQEEADRDLPKLLSTPAVVHGVSYEPALGPVDWRPWLEPWCSQGSRPAPYPHEGGVMCPRCMGNGTGCDGLKWIIVGGESAQRGQDARTFVLGWGKDTIRQCREHGVAVFVKQLGSNPTNREGESHIQFAKKGDDKNEWPAIFRAQEFPG